MRTSLERFSIGGAFVIAAGAAALAATGYNIAPDQQAAASHQLATAYADSGISADCLDQLRTEAAGENIDPEEDVCYDYTADQVAPVKLAAKLENSALAWNFVNNQAVGASVISAVVGTGMLVSTRKPV